jgi:signal transduction histidine kinase
MIEHAIRESQLHAVDVHFAVETVPRDFRLEADAERLHQVVANFVENAVRHSPPQGLVTVRAVAAPDGGARLEVSDEGPGIPAGEVSRVFERFYRADTARSSRDGGAGLGLAIARWIVELHGGDIRVARNEPHGCRMIATIPGRVELAPLPTPQLIN